VCLVAAGATALLACHDLTSSEAAVGLARDTQAMFQSDALRYGPTAVATGYLTRIGVVFTNGTARTAYFVSCNGAWGEPLAPEHSVSNRFLLSGPSPQAWKPDHVGGRVWCSPQRYSPLLAFVESVHLATSVSHSALAIRLSPMSRAADDVARVDARLARLAEWGVDLPPPSHRS
jgi:hypothetical protein